MLQFILLQNFQEVEFIDIILNVFRCFGWAYACILLTLQIILIAEKQKFSIL